MPMKLTHRLPALAAVLCSCLLVLASGCGGDEPAPAAESGDAPPASASVDEPGVSLPPRAANLPPHPELTVTEGANSDGTVTVKGTAFIVGRVPLRKPLVMDHVPGCRSKEVGLTESVLADDEGHLQNVICYVARGLGEEHFQPVPEEAKVLDQVNCTYVPHIMLLRTGQKLVVRNTDRVRHNVNARPWRSANEKFNTLVLRTSPEFEVEFKDQEVAIPFACDMHSWMKAYVAVVDHDFAAITDEAGQFTIAGLPPGKLVFEAWHEEFGRQTLELELEAGQTVEVDWTFLGKKRKGGRVLPLTTDN